MFFLTDPLAIEAQSRKIVEQWVENFSGPEREIVWRMIHATGDAEVARVVEIHPRAVAAAFEVFSRRKKIIVDVKMTKVGINPSLLHSFGVEVFCAIDIPEVQQEARERGCTRAMAGIRFLSRVLSGSLVAIGNAPTALFEVLRLAQEEGLQPSLVVGVPVGFVGAAESKQMLARSGIPYITVHGTRGGSALAVAAVNALLELYNQEVCKNDGKRPRLIVEEEVE